MNLSALEMPRDSDALRRAVRPYAHRAANAASATFCNIAQAENTREAMRCMPPVSPSFRIPVHHVPPPAFEKRHVVQILSQPLMPRLMRGAARRSPRLHR